MHFSFILIKYISMPIVQYTNLMTIKEYAYMLKEKLIFMFMLISSLIQI